MRISRFLLGSSIAAGLLAACSSDPTTTSSTFAAKASAPADASSTGTTDAVTGTVSANAYEVGGTVTGLAGQGLVLSVNGHDVAITANGSFTAGAPVSAGTAYAVTVKSQPTGPNQLCALGGDTGTIGTADVATVTVDCFTDRYIVGGTATGIIGGGVTLQVNGGDDIQVTANGRFAFPGAFPSGQLYTATAKTKPQNPSQTCRVTNGIGKVTDVNATGIQLDCVVDSFDVGGTLSGLVGTIVLQDNNGDDLTRTSNGPFTFATPVASNADYGFRVKTSPTNQTCTITGGSGPVGNGPYTGAMVTCVTNAYSVGGMVTGLAAGDSITLQDNGGDDVTLVADGTFEFAGKIITNASYAVMVKTKPTTNSRCTVTNGSATMATGDVANVTVSCMLPLPPAVCDSGPDPVNASASWVICEASPSRLVLSHAITGAGAAYHSFTICNQLGFTRVGNMNGTWGNVCDTASGPGRIGSTCSSHGTISLPVAANVSTDSGTIGNTVVWECLP